MGEYSMNNGGVNMAGRPSRYKAEYDDQAYKFCLLGATDARLGEFFGVSEQTINAWKTAHPTFLESIKRGKEVADAEIAHALFHRAKGYSHEAVKIFNNQGEIITESYTEHYPPDTGAAMAWLKNRQPQQWRDKQDIEHSGTVKTEVQHDLRKLSPQELMQLESIISKAANTG
jgi:hypothetical protein